MVKKLPIINDPLFHFAIAGALLFVAHSIVNQSAEQEVTTSEENAPIRVGTEQLDHLVVTWKQLWNREPSSLELTRLVNDYVREEALYREAIALGLDEDDTIVRRRMAQKMAFLSKGAAVSEPSPDVLFSWFQENQRRYEIPATVSFVHVYFSTEKRGDQAESDASKVLEVLATENPQPRPHSQLGDRFMSRYEFDDMSRQDLDRLFGDAFAAQVFHMDSMTWHGPVRSSFGWHLVKVSKRTERHVPEFAAVQTQVEIDWMEAQTRAANTELLESLIEKYGLEIQPSEINRLEVDQLFSSES